MNKILFRWTDEARKKLGLLAGKVAEHPACHADAKGH